MKYDGLHTLSFPPKEKRTLFIMPIMLIMIEEKKFKKLVGCDQFYALSGHIIKLD
jgi:hypothetical protein